MRYCNKYIYGFSTLSVFYKMYSRAKLYSKHERICSLRADFILSKRFFAEKNCFTYNMDTQIFIKIKKFR